MPNRLAGESSLYLRQHRDNPVDWHPWGEEAWERARREDRPVLVSIGYSSCHWCHVMERESFEDEATARLMNELLVCIKVDREERPDVDQIYMEAVLRLAGQGGWPLNMFCRPDGRPFHGGTYFPPDRRYGRPSWTEVVQAVARVYREQRGEVDEMAERLLAAIQARPDLPAGGMPGRDALTTLCRKLQQTADPEHGGFGAAPKFPTPTHLEGILCARRLGLADGGAYEQVLLTLKRMARGGLFDQLGGGSHRYSTDARWLIPHFEKMLYDNGQLLRVYAEAYRQTADPELRWPVAETVAWLEREMLRPDGGLCASQDADSEGEEGRYFVWTPAQIDEVLGESAAAFAEAFQVAPEGNFENTGSSVLSLPPDLERAPFDADRARLKAARDQRVPPATDTKCIAAWLAYALGGLASAGSAFAEPAWIDLAEGLADFALSTLSDEGRDLKRISEDGQVKIPAFLDDHAALLGALLDLHRARPEERWLRAAITLAQTIASEFYAEDRQDLFFVRGDDSTLVLRPGSDSDGATPAAAGQALLGLIRIAALTGRTDWEDLSRTVIRTHAPVAEQAPTHLPTLVRAAALLDHGIGVGLIRGAPTDPRSQALADRARTLLGPDDFVVTVPPDTQPDWIAPDWLRDRNPTNGTPTAYLCRGQVCSLPAHAPSELELPPTQATAV